MNVYADLLPSPLVDFFVAVDANGALQHLDFVGRRTRDELVQRVEKRGHAVVWERERCNHVRAQLDEYFRGERRTFELDLAAEGTPFQQRVWRALCRIPFGDTISYGELARRIGSPGASRAVGRANGANPIALVVPCHRVIGADGTLTGYGGGLPTKRALLDFESGQRSFLAGLH